MEWFDVKEKLPPHKEVVLGWGSQHDAGRKEFHLCEFDYEQGWMEYPASDYIIVKQWAQLRGPNGEKEMACGEDD